MHFRRQSMALLCGVLVMAGSAGCAGTGVMSAQKSARGPSAAAPERLVSIGQMFERQGRIQQADSMYRRALRSDPSNETARRQVEYIASLRRTKTFGEPGDTAPQEASVQLVAQTPQSSPAAAQAEQSAESRHRRISRKSSQPQQPTAESLAAAARESLMKTLQPVADPTAAPAPSAEVRGVAQLRPLDNSDRLQSVSQPVVESGRPSATVANPLPVASPTPVAQRPVRQTEPTTQLMAAWMRSPSRHVNPLLMTLRTSHDAEQRALAATLLAEAPSGDRRVNPALEDHCLENAPAVAAAAADSLLARGVVTEQSVRILLALSEHPDSDIRNQSVSSLRRLSGTAWEKQAAHTLVSRLEDTDPAIRGMAALTLGDFSGEAAFIVERLCDRYQRESDQGVQASLELAARRIAELPEESGTSEVKGRASL